MNDNETDKEVIQMDIEIENPHCKDCQHSFEVRDARHQLLYECRRFPPQMQVVVVPPTILGQPPQVQKQSAYPNSTEICGEYLATNFPVMPVAQPEEEDT
jgi:hypothetical protein